LPIKITQRYNLFEQSRFKTFERDFP